MVAGNPSIYFLNIAIILYEGWTILNIKFHVNPQKLLLNLHFTYRMLMSNLSKNVKFFFNTKWKESN